MKWPSKCDSKDVPFADFRTIDAQDLIRVYDTVCASRVSETFKDKYNNLRRERNSLIHSHSLNVRIVAKNLVETIFFATDALVGPRAWLDWRRDMLIAREHKYNSWNFLLTRELNLALHVMGEAAARKYLGINKRRRRYFCPACLSGCTRTEDQMAAYEYIEGLAQLNVKDPNLLNCIVCEEESRVEREKCPDPKCKGNVIGGDWCMICRRIAP